MNAANELDTLAAERAHKVLSVISRRVWNPGRPRSPEKRKLLARLHKAILEVRYLPEDAEDARREAVNLLNAVDENKPLRTFRSRAAVAELVDRWDQLLIAHGRMSYVRGLLATEHVRDTKKQFPTRWRDVFGKPISKGGAKRAWSALEAGRRLSRRREAAVRKMLAELYSTRAELYAFDRARMMTKAHYLWGLVPVLLSLIVVLALALESIDKKEPSEETILAAGLAGALGAAVSGTFKLRDQITRIGQLRAFPPAMVVQLLLGAAAGLFLLAVLQSEVIEIDWGGPPWAEAAVLAFAAGFSEPFFLGIVGRVTAIGEEAEKEDEEEPVGS